MLMNAVAVSLGSQYGGFAEGEGMLRDEGGHLVLEYQIKEALFGGVLKSHVHDVRIPRDTISSATLRKTWLGLKTELVIQTTTMRPIAEIPGMSRGQLVLGVAESDRPAAEKLIADLNLPASSSKPAGNDTGLD
jgi:hypothetical protein